MYTISHRSLASLYISFSPGNMVHGAQFVFSGQSIRRKITKSIGSRACSAFDLVQDRRVWIGRIHKSRSREISTKRCKLSSSIILDFLYKRQVKHTKPSVFLSLAAPETSTKNFSLSNASASLISIQQWHYTSRSRSLPLYTYLYTVRNRWCPFYLL